MRKISYGALWATTGILVSIDLVSIAFMAYCIKNFGISEIAEDSFFGTLVNAADYIEHPATAIEIIWYLLLAWNFAEIAGSHNRRAIETGTTGPYTQSYGFFIWLIPLLNLVKPLAMIRLLKNEAPQIGSSLNTIISNGALKIIWLLFVASIILMKIISKGLSANPAPETLPRLFSISIAVQLAYLIAMFYFVALIRKLRIAYGAETIPKPDAHNV